MNINEVYFQRLLNQADAIEAIFVLSGFWMWRLDDSLEEFGLSVPEWNVQLALIYSGEILNGGHSQYFQNRGVTYLSATICALEEISLTSLAQTLRKASEQLKHSNEKLQFDATSFKAFDTLDIEANTGLETLDVALLKYLRLNETAVLIQERGITYVNAAGKKPLPAV